MSDTAEIIVQHVLRERTAHSATGRCITIGLCGAQGSGKSTAAVRVRDLLDKEGIRVALLSLDDLYLSREARIALAGRVHPLLRTRGVPGTHDVELGETIIDALARGEAVHLPRFDKARDTGMPSARRPAAPAGTDVILFEGWCVGARPQTETCLVAPVNELERREDADGRWRLHVNAALAGAYQRLFSRIDSLVLLAAPGFECVVRWRQEQERQLRAERAVKGRDIALAMTDEEVAVFVQYYERLTRHMLLEMPARAQLVIQLDIARKVTAVQHAVISAPGHSDRTD